MEDRELLREFREHGSEAAFRTLVDRHLGLVHAAARRQVGDAQLAEEVSQAVFLLLARKASSLSGEIRLSGWLYRTTCFVARRAARSELRRRRREQEAFAMQPQETSSEPETWERISPHLDDALGRLGEADRQALLLRFFESRPNRDVGHALGVGEEAAKKRVARALERLRGLLAGSGVVVTVAALGSLLASHAVEAAPPGLSAAIVAPVMGPGTAAGAAPLPGLVRETLNAWAWAKVQAAGALLAGTALVVALALQVVGSRDPAASAPADRSGARAAAPDGGQAVEAPPAGTPRPADAEGTARAGAGPGAGAAGGGGTLLLRVVDEATGRGVPRGRLVVQSVSRSEWRHSLDTSTDDAGFAEIRYPANLGRLDVGILSEGWGSRYATFFPENEDPVPPEYTLRVKASVGSLGGTVEDEAGRPVEGAEVLISVGATGEAAQRETPRERPGAPIEKLPVARTDGAGRWRASVVPVDTVDFGVTVRHPGHAEADLGWVGSQGSASRLPAAGDELSAQLWSGHQVTTLKPAVALAGRLVDGAGRPVGGARLVHEPYSNEKREEVADADGGFAFTGLKERSFDFVVMAAGFAPEYVERTPRVGEPPVQIALRPGATLRVRVVDEQGQPVEDAEVLLEQWGPHRHVLPWSARTGSDGRLEWGSAPPGEELELCVRKPGWCYSRRFKVTAGDAEHEFPLRPALRLSGRVTDAASGRPLAEFKAFPGYGAGPDGWERLATRRGTNGLFSVLFEERQDPWRLRVEADGYAPFISGPIDPGTTEPVAVALRPLPPAAVVQGVVVGADGRPAAGAEVALLTLDHNVGLSGHGFNGVETGPLRLRTDAQGRFRFAPTAFAHSVAAVRDDGFGKVRVPPAGGEVTLRLGAWGRIEGMVESSAQRFPIRSLELLDPTVLEYQGTVRLDFRRVHVTPDASGRFTYEDVPPGEYVVWIDSGDGRQVHHKTPVTVEPGATAELRLRSTGPLLLGRLVAPVPAGATAEDGAIQYASVMRLDPAPPPPRPAEFRETMEAVEYWHSAAGRAWAFHGVNHRLRVEADGTFRSETDLPAGDYLLRVHAAGRAFERRLTLPADLPEGADLDVGEIVLDAPPAVPGVAR